MVKIYKNIHTYQQSPMMYEVKTNRIEVADKFYDNSLLVMDRTTGQESSKEIEDVNE